MLLRQTEILMRYIRVFSDLSSQLRYASQKRVLLEVALIRLTHPAMEPDLDSVLQRIHQLEEQLEDIEARGISAGQGTYGAAGSMAAFGTCGLPGQPSAGSDPAGSLQQSPSGDSGQTSAGISMGSASETISLPKAQLEDLNLIRNEWAKNCPQHRRRSQILSAGYRSRTRREGCLTIVFLDPMSYDMGKRLR